MHQKR
jgi:hypothetical protein